ncbi:MAG: hydroxyacid dehydrogenase [Clostridiaceae bacterium]|nr:hydroxyacid dehydrogenase [Clostridiaceae bacterium]
MRIALLMNADIRSNVISKRTMTKLEALGEIRLNESSGTDLAAIKAVIQDADIAVTSWGNTSLTKEILDCAPDLKLVAHAAGSVKPIVSDELFARNIPLISSAVVLSRSVSETALGLTISAAKNFYNLNTLIHQGGWQHDRKQIRELFEITVGVVGCGYAGSHYIDLLKNFDVDILAYDPFLDAEKIKSLGAEKAELDQILRESDIVSLHAPSIPSTNHIINADTLALMKEDAILINTARGSLIDETALYNHMKAGKLRYACLDVTDPEPPAEDNPLRTLPNCIMTPHLAGLANNGQGRIGVHVYEEIRRLLNHEPLISQVTKEKLATIA